MTYAPTRLLEVRAYLKPITGLSDSDLGIVGDTVSHDGGYHCGWDRRRIVDGVLRDYSWLESTRDSSHKTDAASAFDLGYFARLREFSVWAVKECQAGAPDTLDIREIIYSPDGLVVKRWDRLGKRTSGDSSHLKHTHFSYFRDSEDRDKTALFRRFFEGTREVDMFTVQISGNDACWISDGQVYRPIADYDTLKRYAAIGVPHVVVSSKNELERLAGIAAGAQVAVPVVLTEADRAAIVAGLGDMLGKQLVTLRAGVDADTKDTVTDALTGGAAAVQADKD